MECTKLFSGDHEPETVLLYQDSGGSFEPDSIVKDHSDETLTLSLAQQSTDKLLNRDQPVHKEQDIHIILKYNEDLYLHATTQELITVDCSSILQIDQNVAPTLADSEQDLQPFQTHFVITDNESDDLITTPSIDLIFKLDSMSSTENEQKYHDLCMSTAQTAFDVECTIAARSERVQSMLTQHVDTLKSLNSQQVR